MDTRNEGASTIYMLVECAERLKLMYSSSREEIVDLQTRLVSAQNESRDLRIDRLKLLESHEQSRRLAEEKIQALSADLGVSKGLCAQLAALQPSDLKPSLVEAKSRAFEFKKKLAAAELLLRAKSEEQAEQLRIAEDSLRQKLELLMVRIESLESHRIENESLKVELQNLQARVLEAERKSSSREQLAHRIQEQLDGQRDIHLKLFRIEQEAHLANTELVNENASLRSIIRVFEQRIRCREETCAQLRDRLLLSEREVVELRNFVHANALMEQELKTARETVKELESARNEFRNTQLMNIKLVEKNKRLKEQKSALLQKLTAFMGIPVRKKVLVRTDESQPELIS